MRVFLVTLLLFLSGCVTGEKIDDFAPRSTVYGWIDIKKVGGNNLTTLYLRQYSPKTKRPFFAMGLVKMEGGYMFYKHGFVNGAFKLDKATAQNCLLIVCDNVIYEYNFGSQGAGPGSLVIQQPGAYYLGNFALVREKTGLFEQGKFRLEEVSTGPTKRQMLEEMLKNPPKDAPEVVARIKAELNN